MNRGWLAGGVLVVILAMLSPAWAPADAEHPKQGASAPKDKDPHDEQDNFFKGIVDLSIWTIVVFLVLLFVLGKFAWPMMVEGLDKRERAVASALEKAREVQADAERLKTELDQKFKQANDEIRALHEESRRAAQQNAEEILSKARADIQADRERMNRDVETKADQALQEMWAKVSQVATLVSSKVIRRQLSEDDHRRLVDEALVEMRDAAKERQRVLAGLS